MARDFDSFLCVVSSGCAEWTGVTVKSNGSEAHRYGRYTIGGKKHLAHRFAYERVHGPIPAGLMVLHRCDNPKCCNVNHLFLGTHLDNMADMRAKGRGNKKPPPTGAGANASKAKLTEADVREIRRSRAAGSTTVELSRRFNVHPSVISRAARGVSYSNV
ncbi:HNH endonuclease [Burkholderia cenocepacia]|uniref:HNH endonuclease n=1 Tax=Burkholderia cenocepacia TaxID=95486 RepID=UPI0028763CA2|nr:HNH endonuclease [Burkholderia cenocepacia]MDS0850097.1 HNH endonuclease [Burkholderia cenocepacia]